MNTKLKKNLCTLAFLATVISASAHVPFLKPNQFMVLHNRLVIESSFTEFPFQADFAMTSSHFRMIKPNGSKTELTPVAKTKGAVYLEPDIVDDGTYRISTGIRKGPRYRGIETPEGKLYFSEDTLKFTGRKIELDYYNSADTYIAKGNPDYTPRPLNNGVEIIPLSSPHSLSLGGTLSFLVLNNGSPIKNARIVVAYDDEHYLKHRHGDLYDVENERESNIHSDSEGTFTFTPKQAGLVLMFVTVHKKLNNTLWESHNSSLTLEIHPTFGPAMQDH